jgi:hypothetical protein
MTTPATRTTWVYADTVGRARCRGESCRAPITWAELVTTGRKMCFDGELVALRTDDRDGRQIWEVDLDANHWATCVDSKGFKRR